VAKLHKVGSRDEKTDLSKTGPHAAKGRGRQKYLGEKGLIALITVLSDKYDRRPVLLIGLSIYIVASLGCAIS